MKKLLGIITFSLMLILSLASCGSNNTKIKELLNNLDSKSYDKNGFTMTFNHKYDIESHTNDDYEKIDYTLHYDGAGTIITSIDGLTEDINNYSLYDLITTKVGYIKMIQIEKSNYDYKEENKIDNKNQQEKYNYEINHEFIIKFDESNVYVSSTSKYTDLIDNTKNSNDEFNGKISKELFIENLTPDSIDQFYNQLIVMEGIQTNVTLQNHTSELFVKSKNLNDNDFNTFVNTNQISLEEKKDTSVITFAYPCDQFISATFNIKKNSNAKVKGTLIIDNNKKNLIHFDYDLKDFIFNALDGIDSDNQVTTNINEYKLTGDSFTTSILDIKIEKELNEYTDSDLFMEGLYSTLPLYFD